MTSGDCNPQTPQRNDHNLDSARVLKQSLVSSPSRPPPRKVVVPASPPLQLPESVERPRRLAIHKTGTPSRKPLVDPVLPLNVPTEPAAMRRAQQPRPPPQALQYPLTPRRRVVPNILPSDESDPPSYSQPRSAHTDYVRPLQPCLPFTPQVENIMVGRQGREDYYSTGRNNITSSYNYNPQSIYTPSRTYNSQNVRSPFYEYNSQSGRTSSYNYNPQSVPFVPSQDTPTKLYNGFSNYRGAETSFDTRRVNAPNTPIFSHNEAVNPRTAQQSTGIGFVNLKDTQSNAQTQTIRSQSVRNIAGTELVNYTKAQQSADYADLMADSQPEETWESRRGAPMVPDANSWIESDMFAQQWYNAIILSYRQDAENGERLGGTDEEKEQEMRAKQLGHLTGVNVELEVERHHFEADLLRRARDMILRDNGIMPRGGIGKPAVDGEPQPWGDGLGGTRPERQE